MLIKVNDDKSTVYPYTTAKLRQDNKNVSFPKTLTESILNSFGVYHVSIVYPAVTQVPDTDEFGNAITKTVIPDGKTLNKPAPIFTDGAWYMTYALVNKDVNIVEAEFSILQQNRKKYVRNVFSKASVEGVTDATTTWHGGYDSAMKLDAAKRLAELAGLSTVTFYDVNNIGHELSIADATIVILTVSQKYQTDFAKKQRLMIAIEDATTKPTVQAIVW